MLRSLYFKLDDQNEKHKKIIEYFQKQAKQGNRKIDVLFRLIQTDSVFKR